MTDEQIIKALECYSCTEDGLHEQALNLINRLKGDAIHYRRKAQNQKQELSGLNAEIERLKRGWKADVIETENIKAEAIKELEAKIHEKLHQAEMHGNFEPVVTREMFDSVVKEMVGEQE